MRKAELHFVWSVLELEYKFYTDYGTLDYIELFITRKDAILFPMRPLKVRLRELSGFNEGFDPNYTDRDGWTSLQRAAKNGSAGTVGICKSRAGHQTRSPLFITTVLYQHQTLLQLMKTDCSIQQ